MIGSPWPSGWVGDSCGCRPMCATPVGVCFAEGRTLHRPRALTANMEANVLFVRARTRSGEKREGDCASFDPGRGISPRMSASDSVVLSNGFVMIFVLRNSGCRGRISAGRVERTGSGELNCYDQYGILDAYFSGTNIRSWCVLGPDGQAVDGWCKVTPGDSQKIFPQPSEA